MSWQVTKIARKIGAQQVEAAQEIHKTCCAPTWRIMHAARRIQGKRQLDQDWIGWLEGFTFNYTDQDETVLAGSVKDQSSLYGLIAKLRAWE